MLAERQRLRSDLHKNGNVHFEVLGSLRVSDGDREIDIARPKERGVLAALLVEANSVVPLDRLCLGPQCGFSCGFAGSPMTYESQLQKLQRIVEVARSVWGD